MGAFGGFLSGIGNGVQKKQQQDMVTSAPATSSVAQHPIQTGPFGGLFGGKWGTSPVINNATTVNPQPVASAQTPNAQPINSQQQQQGFHGLVPMVQNYYANHQAKVQDMSAQPHIQSLQDPNTTPEQRQYHVNSLQQVYANRPDVLHQLGISNPNAYNVPNVGTTAVPPAGGK